MWVVDEDDCYSKEYLLYFRRGCYFDSFLFGVYLYFCSYVSVVSARLNRFQMYGCFWIWCQNLPQTHIWFCMYVPFGNMFFCQFFHIFYKRKYRVFSDSRNATDGAIFKFRDHSPWSYTISYTIDSVVCVSNRKFLSGHTTIIWCMILCILVLVLKFDVRDFKLRFYLEHVPTYRNLQSEHKKSTTSEIMKTLAIMRPKLWTLDIYLFAQHLNGFGVLFFR